MGLPTGPKEKKSNEAKAGFFLPLDYYNFDSADEDPQKILDEKR